MLDPFVEAKEADQAGTVSETTSLLRDGSGFLIYSTKQNFKFNRLYNRLHHIDGFKHCFAVRDTFDNGPFSGNKSKMSFIKGVLTFHLGANHSQLIPQDTYENEPQLKAYVNKVGKVTKLGQQEFKPYGTVLRKPTMLI